MTPELIQLSDVAKTLAPAEAEELIMCEAVIERGMRDFETMGRALRAVRDKKLYREKFGTFESYCQSRWEMEVRQAQRLMAGADINEELRSAAPAPITMPPSERHVRPLAVLPQGERSAAWAEVVASARGARITVAHVEETVKRIRGIEPKVLAHGHHAAAKAPVVVDVREGGDREARLLAAADRVIAPARELADLLGSADSVASAEAQAALRTYENLKEHLQRISELQAARAAAQRDERKAA